VAEPCLAIQRDPSLSFALTRRWNLVAVVTDGTAVLGLGDIGPEAAMPVMEGKCALFKSFADVDAFPLCIRSKDTEEIVNTVKLLCGSFGGINLEDIAAPRCFEIERRLKAECDIPVFHDDQHGTAVVVLAALINALKVTGKRAQEIKIAINGAGAAAIATAKLLLRYGVRHIVLCDLAGIIYEGRAGMDETLTEIAALTNREGIKGGIGDMIKGADVFIGLSAGDCVSGDMIKTMAKEPVVFAMANPVPEIMPAAAKEAGARVVGTGRSDHANQINNVLAFPGIFRGALDVRARDINEEMKLAAAKAIAALVADDELDENYILPPAFMTGVAAAVAKAVAKAAIASGAAKSIDN
jgi:malate dehydrogenase (oxaloacetate-decarboxylating)